MSRAAIVAEARTWIDAPLFHHGRSREGGVDCLGLVVCVGIAAGVLPGDIAIPDYGQLPNPRRLVAAMDAVAIRLTDHDALSFETASPPLTAAGRFDDGDVIGMSWGLRGAPMHLGIAATFQGRRMIIQANPGFRRVTETGFAGAWSAAFCVAWRYPDLRI